MRKLIKTNVARCLVHFLVLGAALLMSACGSKQSVKLYTLNDLPPNLSALKFDAPNSKGLNSSVSNLNAINLNSPKVKNSKTLPASSLKGFTLKVFSPQSALYLKSEDIAYIKGNKFGSYSEHAFNSAPVALFRQNLMYKLEAANAFKAVVSELSLVKADFVLESVLEHFEQVFDANNQSMVQISANISLLKGDKLLAQRHFSKQMRVRAFSPAASIEAFELALNALNDEITIWILQSLSFERF